MAGRPRIVVGVDGSDHARRALRWALEEARLRQATIVAVHAWHLPYDGSHPYTALAFDPDRFEHQARSTLERAVHAEDTHGLAAPVETVVVHGTAAAALLEAANGADLLVVGARGLGGFTGLLLGSVSNQVSHHASCPVVIVPPAPERRGTGDEHR